MLAATSYIAMYLPNVAIECWPIAIFLMYNIFTFKFATLNAEFVIRDECPRQGMLAVSRAVLMKVHSGVFAALAAPPVAGPNGEPVYSNWDVRHVLSCERQKVRCARCPVHHNIRNWQSIRCLGTSFRELVAQKWARYEFS